MRSEKMANSWRRGRENTEYRIWNLESGTWNPANTNSWLDVPYRSSPQLHLLKTRCYDALALGDNSIAAIVSPFDVFART